MTLYDVCIIGAGPAGMTAAIYAARAQLSVLLLEASVPGGKVVLTSEVENWPGRSHISGPDLARELFEHVQNYDIAYVNTPVTSLESRGEVKRIHCGDELYEARCLILASGTLERKLGIPGEREGYGQGVSYCAVCDGAFFRKQHVAVIGGGNSAFEDAVYLTRFAEHVDIFTRRDQARADRTNQQRLMENEKITWHKCYSPEEILLDDEGYVRGLRLRSTTDGTEFSVDCQAVFPMVGLDANTAFVDCPEILDKEGFVLVDSDCRTTVPGLFAAGDVCAKSLRQIVTASSDGAIAAQAAVHYLEAQEG